MRKKYLFVDHDVCKCIFVPVCWYKLHNYIEHTECLHQLFCLGFQCVSLDETLSKCRHDPQRQRAKKLKN